MPDVQRISWVLKKLADGDFTIGFDEDGHREFRFSDVSAETEELEIELFSYVHPDDTAAFDRFLKTRNAETLKELLDAIFPSKLSEEILQELAGAPYDVAVRLVVSHCRLLDEVTDRKWVRRQEGAQSRAEYLQDKELQGLGRIWDGTKRHRIVRTYAREVADQFPAMVERAQQLSQFAVIGTLPEYVENYLREASKCFVQGRYIGCLLVCRSAIELGLRDFLKRQGKEAELRQLRAEQGDGLCGMINLARPFAKWTLRPTLDDADEVRRKANNVAHEGAPPAETCKELFIKTRGVLKELYSKGKVGMKLGGATLQGCQQEGEESFGL